MATLSKVTSLTRNFIKWAGLGLGALLVILLLYKIAIFIKEQITPPPPPTVSFDKLPAISFPQGQTAKDLSYSIDTVTGALPTFSDRANVYKTTPFTPDLLALDNASTKVNSNGFEGQGTQISENLYQWVSKKTDSDLQRKIVYDIFSGDFNLSSNFLEDSNVLSGNNLPNETAAINSAQSFLSNMSSVPDDINLEKSQTALYSIKNGDLVPALSLSSTQVIRISFSQKDIGDFPVVYPEPSSSTMNVFVGGGSNSPQIAKIDFFHQNIASQSATYPIISASDAFAKLKDGDAYIASFDGSGEKISINKVTLGYFLSDNPQSYVMPVVIFKGNRDFTAYVSAVKDVWVQK